MNRAEAMKASWARRKAEGTVVKYKKKKRKKGKWSKMARAKHSVRMKERFAAKNKAAVSVVTTNKLTVMERLDIIDHHNQAIRQQLGGFNGREVSGVQEV